MLIVIALGGNALLRRGDAASDATQRANVERAAHALAPFARDHRLVITHGNGPQVGLLALRESAAARDGTGSGLDVLGAETQGMIGYLIEEAMREVLPGLEVATLLTQVEVDRADPAFDAPTKPIGPVYDEPTARRLATERGWDIAPDGTGYRRVVASPEPQRILELPAIRALLAARFVVVCAGGGGVPVVLDAAGAIEGVEAVIDKDLASALLATHIGAERLLLLTDVDAVYDDWGTPQARPIRRATVAEMRARTLTAGSMGPKVEAACRFAAAGGIASASARGT
ncbi:MAG: carbamate kinase, partial [Chloroflexota bacterium]